MVFFHIKMNILSFLSEIILLFLGAFLRLIPNLSYPVTIDKNEKTKKCKTCSVKRFSKNKEKVLYNVICSKNK